MKAILEKIYNNLAKPNASQFLEGCSLTKTTSKLVVFPDINGMGKIFSTKLYLQVKGSTRIFFLPILPEKKSRAGCFISIDLVYHQISWWQAFISESMSLGGHSRSRVKGICHPYNSQSSSFCFKQWWYKPQTPPPPPPPPPHHHHHHHHHEIQ